MLVEQHAFVAMSRTWNNTLFCAHWRTLRQVHTMHLSSYFVMSKANFAGLLPDHAKILHVPRHVEVIKFHSS
jgi:hypothetical protein